MTKRLSASTWQHVRGSALWWQELRSRPRSAFSFAALAAVIVAGWLGVRFLRSPSAEQLLAEAYTEHRTLELRLEGAAHGKRSLVRGSSRTDSTADRPLALLEAENLIAHKLQQDADNPKWLQMRARADLLEGHADAAVKMLQPLLLEDPQSNSLRIDLATAYFERANATDRSADYGEAVELLERALHSDPHSAVSLFNEATVLERLFLFRQAIETWSRYLVVDPASPWADEARVNLQRVQEKLAEREKRSASPLLSPAEFARVVESGGEQAVSAIDERVERYLEAAVQSWLPQAYAGKSQGSPPAFEGRRALDALALILKRRHDDDWLSKFLESVRSTHQGNAIRDLIASNDALHSGRYATSVLFARRSRSEFQQARNGAGVLWSGFVLIYAHTFALQFGQCLQVAAKVLPPMEATHFRWLQAQMLIQQGECQDGMARLQEAIWSASKGARLAERFHYPSLVLRATGFAAMYSVYAGDLDRGLRGLAGGLAEFWQSDVSNTRGENLYSCLSDLANAKDWPHTNAFATSELLADFPVQDPVDRAVQLQILAEAQEKASDYGAAAQTLQTVSNTIANLPQDQAVVLRRAEVAVQNARISLLRGNAQRAVSSLSQYRQYFEAADPGQFQAEYFKTYGEALLAQGRDREAEPALQRALIVAETYLTDLRSEAARLSWSRFQGQLYRDVLGIKLRSESASAALSWWEWYRDASLRTPLGGTFQSKGIRAADGISAKLSRNVLPAGTVLVSYALLSDSATAFVFREGNAKVHALQLPGDIEPLVLRFLRHCTAPGSSLQRLDAESSRLYDILIAPLESDLQGATALLIETDRVLDRLPFDLLHKAGGPYLMDRFNLSFSPGLAYAAPAPRETLSSLSPALIVAATDAQGKELPALPEAGQESDDVASFFSRAKLLSGNQASREAVLEDLRGAAVFHFSGHAVANVAGVGLILQQESMLDAHALARVGLRKLQLAVLSACDTANGDTGEFTDVNSLARTLIGAGVPRVVASRWRVDSVATRLLMHAFYSSLLAGKTPADSLRAARSALRSTAGYQHPYYWGSFAVFGR